MSEELINSLKREKDHLEKVILAVETGWQYFRPPYGLRSMSVKENIQMISHNLDKLCEQVK